MRRLGLLTAVFALAVGIVVAFEASPDAAQPQPRAHVYLLRGLLNIFSLGMDTLAEELKGRDVYATVHSYSAKVRRGVEDFSQNLRRPIGALRPSNFCPYPAPSEQINNSRSVLRDLTNNAEKTNKRRGAVRFNFRCCA